MKAVLRKRWYNYGFKFQDSVCNVCHDLTIFCLNMSDVVIIIVKNVDYRCIIHDINNSQAIVLLENAVLEDRGYTYKCISKKSMLKM